jgi:SAM-dependent methyltransferase
MDSAGWDERYAASELVWSAEPNRFVVEELEPLPPGRALDLAAGEGRNAIWLASRGWAVTAVDFSAIGIEKGRRLASAAGVSVDFVVADVCEYQPEPGGFDIALIAYLHIPWPRFAGVLGRAAGALAPAGTLLVVGHDRTNLTDGVGGPQDPAVLYDAKEITAELGGLRIERAGQVRRPAGTPEEPADAIDTLVRARRP